MPDIRVLLELAAAVSVTLLLTVWVLYARAILRCSHEVKRERERTERRRHRDNVFS